MVIMKNETYNLGLVHVVNGTKEGGITLVGLPSILVGRKEKSCFL